MNQTAACSPEFQLASAPFGRSFEDLRVGLTGKVSAEVGYLELPVRVADDAKCAINNNCGKGKGS